jgi:hypothetical protein
MSIKGEINQLIFWWREGKSRTGLVLIWLGIVAMFISFRDGAWTAIFNAIKQLFVG